MTTMWASLLLLLWGSVYLSVPTGSYGALIVSEGEQQDSAGPSTGNRILKKRSVSSDEIEVQSVKIDCKVASRFAHTVMTSTALNKANFSQEVFFEVELPKTAFMTNFSMEIDGKIYVGEVKEKEKAKKQYEQAVSTGQTAGLVKASGRKMEKFSVSVNIAANTSVTFTLTYEELLQRGFGKYEIMIRVKPKQPVQQFEIVADIYEPQGIAFLDAHATFITNELLPLVKKTLTDKMAHISFSPTLEQQRPCPQCGGTLIDGDFVIKYDVNRVQDIGDIQIVNGYFVHFFAPADLPRLPKNVVFVIDRSGSMYNIKMDQTRKALVTILTDLNEEDHFGLVPFDSTVSPWRPSLSKATPENVKAAKEFVLTIEAGGWTNINEAVLAAVNILTAAEKNNTVPDRSASMIILLTDGDPSFGVRHLPTIQSNVRNAIGGNMSLFCLGFGNDVDYNFLDVLAKQNDGLARRIYEASDAVLQLQGFYDEVSSPLLSEVHFKYPENTVNSLTSSHFKQLFNGSEIVVAGRLNDLEMNDFPVEVSAQGLENDFMVKGQASAQEKSPIFPDQEYIFGDFTERLWAYLTIQQLLDKRDKSTAEEKVNITAKALDLSLRYNFVTPLTSLVVTKPQNDEKPEDAVIADKLTEAQRTDTQDSGPTSSQTGYRYASAPVNTVQHKQTQASGHIPSHRYASTPVHSVDGDPHFIIGLPDKNDALCFNIDDKPGTIFNLVKDPLTGTVVNGQTIGDKKVEPGSKINTYFGRFGIVLQKFGIRLMVSTQEILVSERGKQAKLFWSESATIKGHNMDLQVTEDRSLSVTVKNSVKFVIILHKVWKMHPYHQDYLGFYTLDSHLFSPKVHGLLGQFYNGVQFEVSELFPGENEEKPDAIMFVKGHQLVVTRGWQRDFRKDVKNGENVPCWFIHNNGTGIIDGELSDYIVSGLFKTNFKSN
ncbi:inter-alpha-trypsin inhibitor heavy chain H3 isoform X1 [Astyanax mexicanus]|uniref:inter-alpha-trypsin inhibitor heavy chain H3 isoform X1 n=1 Tax=Astyanax mexicanus TaxID=7994 RepID=UPI0020CB015A|nr:inter-alpha-trypsin inhibitor heavy chain H3 isoform X1 [Astyanax mexicanus]